MFCPKCGSQLPDGSAFCGQCGAQLRAPAASPAAAPGVSAPAGGARAAIGPTGRVSPVGIAAAVLAAVAVVVSLLGWFEVYPGYTSLTGYVDQAASFFGIGSSSSLSFDESYAPWALPGFAGTFGEYASLYGSLGGSNAGGAAAIVTIVCWACTLLWAVAAILIVLGAVGVLRGGGRGVMLVGAIVAVVCAVAFLVFCGMADDMGEATIMPLVFVAAAIAAAVCSFIDKKA